MSKKEVSDNPQERTYLNKTARTIWHLHTGVGLWSLTLTHYRTSRVQKHHKNGSKPYFMLKDPEFWFKRGKCNKCIENTNLRVCKMQSHSDKVLFHNQSAAKLQSNPALIWIFSSTLITAWNSLDWNHSAATKWKWFCLIQSWPKGHIQKTISWTVHSDLH